MSDQISSGRVLLEISSLPEAALALATSVAANGDDPVLWSVLRSSGGYYTLPSPGGNGTHIYDIVWPWIPHMRAYGHIQELLEFLVANGAIVSGLFGVANQGVWRVTTSEVSHGRPALVAVSLGDDELGSVEVTTLALSADQFWGQMHENSSSDRFPNHSLLRQS